MALTEQGWPCISGLDFENSSSKLKMAEKGRLTIDLNASADSLDNSNYVELCEHANLAQEITPPACTTTSFESARAAQTDRSTTETSGSARQAQVEGPSKDDMGSVKQIQNGAEPSTMDVVIAYRLHTNNAGNAAQFIGEAGTPKNGKPLNCQCCGKPERVKKTLICDVCEQSFHMKCLRIRENQAAELDEWVCMACVGKQGRQSWALGRIECKREVEAKIVNDEGTLGNQQRADFETGVSASGSQPKRLKRNRDVEYDVNSMKKSQGTSPDEIKTRNSSRLKALSHMKEDGQLKGSNLLNPERAEAVESGPAGEADSLQTSLSTCSKDGDEDIESSSKDMDIESLGQQHMQKLKEFILQHQGVLADEWRVVVKKRLNSDRMIDVNFYSPDGQKFRSKLEVARYLGLFDQKRGDVSSTTPVARVRKRKDLAREQKHAYVSEDEEQSDDDSLELAKRRKVEVHSDFEFQEPPSELELQLPLQCLDLRVESLGVVELRHGYFDDNHIWPVGYRCVWHDGVTGSVCISEVLDGGPSTPIFRVTRRSCSISSDICNGVRQGHLQTLEKSFEKRPCNNINVNNLEVPCKLEPYDRNNSDVQYTHIYDEDDELNVLVGALGSFTTDCVSNENMLGLPAGKEGWDNCVNAGHVHQDLKQKKKDSGLNPYLNREKSDFGDALGLTKAKMRIEASAQGGGNFGGTLESNAAVMPVELGEIVVESTTTSGAWRLLGEKLLEHFKDSFEKGEFQLGCKHEESSSSSSMFQLPDFVEGLMRGDGQHKMAPLHTRLQQWISQDRFGFDIPDVQKYLRAKKAHLQAMRPPPPMGLPICQKLPAEFVGDILQIWEFLCRFSEVLGLKEPPSLEELEESISDPSQIEMGKDDCIHKKESVPVGELADQGKSKLQMNSERCFKAELSTRGSTEWQQTQGGKIGPTSNVDGQSFRLKKVSKNGSSSASGFPSVALAASHMSLLKVALSDFPQKALVGGPDVTLETKRGKKKDGESGLSSKKQVGSVLPLNELTWLEVARRYVIALSALHSGGENIEVQERRKILQCIQGDGGVLCGALDGVAGLEADAQLLAEAEKHVSNWIKIIEGDPKSGSEGSHKDTVDEKTLQEMPSGYILKKPAWARTLEPVRKLATNVGARIRNCVRDALELNPPDWARDILEWSISKDVYKGNASGPTKRAVLSVLDQVKDEKQTPAKIERKIEHVVPTPALVMRRCRLILRQIVTTDDVRIFCNSLGGTVLGYYENEEDNMEVPLPLVTRPLDFRIIDSRLAAGSYGDSHESFAADIRQLFRNVPVVFQKREDFIRVGESLAHQFESLYEEKVIKLISGKEEVKELKETTNQISASKSNDDVKKLGGLDEELMKAPWEEGVCKTCGIDKDDDTVLLCDGCDAEYHIYCLEPPLSKIPDGNWYCPSCVPHEQQGISNHGSSAGESHRTVPKQLHRSKLTDNGNILPGLVVSMAGRDYWQLNGSERVHLLKLLCDKVLESTVIRDHIDQCTEATVELQQKLRLLLLERQSCMGKGSHVMDDLIAMDNTEAGNKDASISKKRGRRSLKTSVPSSIMEENDRAESGLQIEHPSGSGIYEYGEIPVFVKQSSGYEEGSMRKRAGSAIWEVREKETSLHLRSGTGITLVAPVNQIDCEVEQKGNLVEKVVEPLASCEHQASNGAFEDLSKVRLHLPETGSAVSIQKKLVEELKVAGDQLSLDNLGQNNVSGFDANRANGSAVQLLELGDDLSQGSSKGKGTMEGMAVECRGLFNGAVIRPLPNCVDSAGERDKENKISLEGRTPEGRMFKHYLPVSTLSLQHSVEQQASPLVDVQACSAQTTGESLEMEIEKVEAEIMKTASRRECLGRDALGRAYWALGWVGKVPWLVVEGMPSSSRLLNSGKEFSGNCAVDSGAEIASNERSMSSIQTPVRVQSGIRDLSMTGASHALSIEKVQTGVKEWVMYESDECIEQIIKWLKPTIHVEKNLKAAISKWCTLWSRKFSREKDQKQLSKARTTTGVFLTTKAAAFLVKKFGPISWPNGPSELHAKKRGSLKKDSGEQKLFRCDCLELVWATRHHCPCCHETFDSLTELHDHNNGACSFASEEQAGILPVLSKVKKRKVEISNRVSRFTVDSMDGIKKKKAKRKLQEFVPPDLSFVVKLFSLPSSMRERVVQIGCIADKGPTFMPPLSCSPFFDPSLSMTHPSGHFLSDITCIGRRFHGIEEGAGYKQDGRLTDSNCMLSLQVTSGPSIINTASRPSLKAMLPSNSVSTTVGFNEGNNGMTNASERDAKLPFAKVCEGSQTRAALFGKNMWILKRLKANLLDIESVLSIDALEPSRSQPKRRRAWRLFVKSSASIPELVQALMLLEHMVKADCLRDTWCNWTCLSAGAGISTLSSLALRVYSFDASIKYKRAMISLDTEGHKASKSGRKKKT